jgi:hypothetical protein
VLIRGPAIIEVKESPDAHMTPCHHRARVVDTSPHCCQVRGVDEAGKRPNAVGEGIEKQSDDPYADCGKRGLQMGGQGRWSCAQCEGERVGREMGQGRVEQWEGEGSGCVCDW